MPALDVARQFIHQLDRVWLQQIFVIEMIKEDVEAFLGVGHMLLVLCGSFCLYALHIRIKDLVDGTGSMRDVRSVTRSFYTLARISWRIQSTYDTWRHWREEHSATVKCQDESLASVVHPEEVLLVGDQHAVGLAVDLEVVVRRRQPPSLAGQARLRTGKAPRRNLEGVQCSEAVAFLLAVRKAVSLEQEHNDLTVEQLMMADYREMPHVVMVLGLEGQTHQVELERMHSQVTVHTGLVRQLVPDRMAEMSPEVGLEEGPLVEEGVLTSHPE